MKIRSIALAPCLAVLAHSGWARADDASDIEGILNEHVISTASATAQRASVAPALSTTITAEDIQALGIRSLAEAIDFLSLGVITADPLRTPDIGSRGVLFANDDGKHFLLLKPGETSVGQRKYIALFFDDVVLGNGKKPLR